MTKASRAGVKRVISDRERGENPAATGTVSPLPAEIYTSQRHPREELNPRGGEGGGPPLHMKFSRDATLSRIPAPDLLKQARTTPASFGDSLQYLEPNSPT